MQTLTLKLYRIGDHHRSAARVARLDAFGLTLCLYAADVQRHHRNSRSCRQLQLIRAHFPNLVLSLRLRLGPARIRKIVEIVATRSQIWLHHRKCQHRILGGSAFITVQIEEVVAKLLPGLDKLSCPRTRLTELNIKRTDSQIDVRDNTHGRTPQLNPRVNGHTGRSEEECRFYSQRNADLGFDI